MLRRALAVAALGLSLHGGGLAAQEGARPGPLVVGPDGGLALRLGVFLEDERLREALDSGLPLRLRVLTELWKDRLFDSEEGRSEWRASLVYDLLDGRYQVRTGDAPGVVRSVASFGAAANLVEERFAPGVGPASAGRYYYLVTVEVATLSLSDLEELQRWLQGELGGDTEDDDLGGSVTGGVGRIVGRVLGLPGIRERLRSPRFDWPGPSGVPGSRPPPSGQ